MWELCAECVIAGVNRRFDLTLTVAQTLQKSFNSFQNGPKTFNVFCNNALLLTVQLVEYRNYLKGHCHGDFSVIFNKAGLEP